VFDAFLYIFIAVLGLCVGSFLNVVVFRFGFNESSAPRSHCMACNGPLAPLDMVPVISFLFLGGKCRACGSKLSVQYPLVEFITAVLFVLSYVFLPPAQTLFGYAAFAALLVFLAALVALVVYDVRHTIVPLPFVYALLASAASASALQALSISSLMPVFDSLAGGVTLAAFFFLIYAITRGRGMGLGDAYVAGAAGILLGFSRGIEAVMFAFWIGTAVYLPIMLIGYLGGKGQGGRRLRVTMKTELPFVPFLALGVILALFTPLSPLAFGAWLANTLWFH
jgi:prepilin signal peptidase PulO-like enzyme (type II secretory pathway)